jgi:hypothetical protein
MKALAIKGRAKGGLLANGPALELLRGNRPEGPGELEVVITEGEPDFLVASLEPHENTRAVFGVLGGTSWPIEASAKIPTDARVVIATDWDDDGKRYANDIRATLQGQRVLHRWQPWSAGLQKINQNLSPGTGKLKNDVTDVFGLRGGESHAI